VRNREGIQWNRIRSNRRLCCSVVIPVFNRTDQLSALLQRLTVQSTPASQFEVIVCDDGSTESVKNVILEFQSSIPHLRYLRQEQRGAAAARNTGIIHAVSDIVVFLDSDVEPDRHLIRELTYSLMIHPEWQGAAAIWERLTGGDEPLCDVSRANHDGWHQTAGIAYRTEILRSVGGLDESFINAACEDVDLAVRVLERGEIGIVLGAIVHQPPRRRTAASCWRARKRWRSVRVMACRYGFLQWRCRYTRFPRLRTAIAASFLQPLDRLFTAMRLIGRNPGESIRGAFLSVVDWIGGISMVPSILLEATPSRVSSVGARDLAQKWETPANGSPADTRPQPTPAVLHQLRQSLQTPPAA